jgi:enoyl-CoA hydratase/carnithine racemase
MKPAVTYESRDRIATITIDRPEQLNAINREVELGLAAAWQRLNDGDDLVAILTGAGDKAFSVGKDLEEPSTPDYRRFVPGFDIAVSKPVIAAVGGWCVGGALTIVQMCDLCVASERARFLYPEAKIGFAGGLIASLAGRMPHKVAMEVMLLGEELSAERAYQVGFVNKLVPHGEHLAAARVYAQRLAANAPMVLSLLKDFVGQVLPKGPMEQASQALHRVESVMDSADRREGMDSFTQKRTPNFLGR